MAAWLECCYGSQPLLHLGKHTILSQCGVQQGDRLGPLAFALSLHPVVERIKQEVPGLLINAWYLDDGTLCGSARDLCAALAIVEDGLARGLFLNKRKSLLFVPEDAAFGLPILSIIRHVTHMYPIMPSLTCTGCGSIRYLCCGVHATMNYDCLSCFCLCT